MAMGRGTDSALSIALKRRTKEVMEDDFSNRPQSVLFYESVKERGFSGPSLWHVKSAELAAKPFSVREWNPADWNRKNEEYMQLVRQIRARQALDYVFTDKKRGIEYVTQENDQVRNVLTQIIYNLAGWVVVHSSDRDFLTVPAQGGLARMLEERQDLVAALRLAQETKKDVAIWRVPIDRPTVVTVVEVAVSLIPVVGTAVALFESVTGSDLFGYELDSIDRGILAAGALLPIASRFVKGGRVLYTAARLEHLYGPGAAKWSIALATGERLAADTKGLAAIGKADALTKAHTKAEAGLVKEVVDTLERAGLNRAAPAASSSLPAYVSDALKKLISSRSFLSELDELSLSRLIDKAPNINLMKGQLLEELLESRIASWLRDPAGLAALGIERPPEGIRFIPGHLIRDAAGRQLTDGILARQAGDVLEILAIFEAKAGKSAARELKLASESISSLSTAERAELRAYARDIFRSRLSRARRLGQSVPTGTDAVDEALNQIEREIIQSEQGGQVRRDIERLAPNADGGLPRIVIGTEETQVRISPTKTKIFGVLPKDVPVGTMEQDLRQLGYSFEVLGMNVTQQQLVDLTQSLLVAAP